MLRILVRYLDRDGHQIDELVTQREWSASEVELERESLLRVGPPADDRIVAAELVPLAEIEGDEIALDELHERLPDLAEQVATKARDILKLPIAYPVAVDWR